jgi:parvulin-like peptidyl-prolyl isomerase
LAGEYRSSRRLEIEAENRRQRLIVMGVVAGMMAVVAIIGVGLYFTQYRAPRAHLLTVNGQEHNAADVARRATYAVISEGGLPGAAETIATNTIELLINEEALRTQSAAAVGVIGPAEIEEELRTRYGLIEIEEPVEIDDAPTDSTPTDGTATATPTPEPTPETTATAEPEEQEDLYPGLLAEAVSRSGLRLDEFYSVITAQIVRNRLTDQFEEALETSAPQVRLSRIRVTTEIAAEELRSLVDGGADFGDLAREDTIDSAHRDDGGDLGWATVSSLEPEVAEAIAGIEIGALAPVVPAGLFFDLYLVAEEEDRELDAQQIDDGVEQELFDWLDQARAAIEIRETLSGSEAEWVTDKVIDEIQKRTG